MDKLNLILTIILKILIIVCLGYAIYCYHDHRQAQTEFVKRMIELQRLSNNY